MLSPLLCSSDTVTPQAQKLKTVEMAGSELATPKEKKKMPSPRSKTKHQETKTFGIPLPDLMNKRPHLSGVPFCVHRICDYILEHGLSQEGIFRVNGNMKVVEQLKTQFDKTGDAALEDCGDMMAVAGLLKLFLRTLPDPVICEDIHSQFIDAHRALHKEKEKLKPVTSGLLSLLPPLNIQLLRYLTQFLVTVSCHSEQNKMTPMALAIVFGPNIFRCSMGFEGLREQSHVNAIVCLFIDSFDQLFGKRMLPSIRTDTGERQSPMIPIPYHEYQRTKSMKAKPARPPPPNLHEFKRSNSDAVLFASRIQDLASDTPPTFIGTTTGQTPLTSVEEITSPSCEIVGIDEALTRDMNSSSDKDIARSVSPLMMVPHARGKQVVDCVVQGSVKEHLFGPHSVLSSSSDSDSQVDHSIIKIKSTETTPSEEAADTGKKVKDRLKRFVSLSANKNPSPTPRDGNSPSTVKSTSPNLTGDRGGQAKVKLSEEDPEFEVEPFKLDRSAFKSFDIVGSRASAPLSAITANRAPLPRNRRKPSFSHNDESHDNALDPASIARRRLDEAKEARADLDSRQPTGVQELLPSMTDSKKKSKSASDLLAASPGRGYGIPSRSAIRMDIGRAMEYRDDMNPTAHLRPKSIDVHLAAPTSPLTVGSPASAKATVVPPLDLLCLQADDGEQAQPSPMGRFPHVIADGPVRSPRSVGGSSADEVPVADIQSSTTEPPSPTQVHREQLWLEKRQDTAPVTEMGPKELKRRIESLKKIVSNFESSFEEQNGRKPKPSEKGLVQKYIAELGRAKKQFKELMVDLKDLPDHLTDSAPSLLEIQGVKSNCLDATTSLQCPEATKEETLNCLLKKLQEKRLQDGRPEEIQAMSEDQLSSEKLAVQKALLQYESIHCRPTTKEDKNLMRPLYERYRRIKRILSRANINKTTGRTTPDQSEITDENGSEFDSIREGVSISHDASRQDGNHSPRKPSIVRTLAPTTFNNEDEFGETFSVTARPADISASNGDTSKTSFSSSSLLEEAVLHDATLQELLQQQILARKAKKRLGKKLKFFEEDFLRDTGRKITKDDRGNMENEYREYKATKSRLRLLDALILKKNTVQLV